MFGVEYVERLHDMVRRNLPDGFGGRFVCFTDRPQDLAGLAGVETQPLPPGLNGWWNKLALFAPDAFPAGDRVWYFDLDTAITGQLEKLFEYTGHFAILEDVYRKDGFQSSVMSWSAGSALSNSIWSEFERLGRPVHPHGDQGFLEVFWSDYLPVLIGSTPWPPDMLQQQFPGAFRSYKAECVWSVPKGTSVVFFHGLPRPHQVLTGWVPEVWKVGGGSAFDIVTVGTVAQEAVLRNVKDAIEKNYPVLEEQLPHDRLAVICAGGPSLAEHLFLAGSMQGAGAAIFAVNNTDAFLRHRGMRPNFHVMTDARSELVEWVNAGGIKLYASMCDPAVLSRAEEVGDLTVWHSATDGIGPLFGEERTFLVGGGSTVGLRAVVLAWVMGFRRVMLLGFDSCYESGKHHAYEQKLNDGERVLDVIVGGKRFKAAPWMVQQAEDFKSLVPELQKMGMQIAVMGDGLIGQIVKSLAGHELEVDGFQIPKGDGTTIDMILGSLDDLDAYVALCEQKRTVIQAGGHIGIWAKHLSKRFERVFTFEPNASNYEFLVKNLAGVENVYKYGLGLGEKSGSAGMVQGENSGAGYLNPGGTGVTIVPIDHFGIVDLDLLVLDVEGFELQALKGAADTIRRCSPVIVLELKDLGERYGYSDCDVGEWLGGLGYQQYGVSHRDVIFKRSINQARISANE